MDAKRIAKDIDFEIEKWSVDECDSRSRTEVCADMIQAHINMNKRAIDWPAEARKAAIALLASGDYDAYGACIGAEVLIAEMKRREAFGGGG